MDCITLLRFLERATISNDGATIMKLLDIVHPAAKTLVDIAKSQDAEVSNLIYLLVGHQSLVVGTHQPVCIS